MIHRILTLISIIFFFLKGSYSQDVVQSDLPVMDYSYPSEYEIADISISGVKYLDENILIQLSGLQVGDKFLIPGERITMAIEKLWSQGLFSDMKITAPKIEGNKIYLDIFLKELPRLSRFSFTGISRSETQDLLEKLNLISGNQVTENVINNARK